MAFDESLAENLRAALTRRAGISEKKMFGGLTFLLNGNMLCGTTGRDYMFRVGAEGEASALDITHVRPCDFTGRPLKGLVMADADRLARGEFDTLVTLSAGFVAGLPDKG